MNGVSDLRRTAARSLAWAILQTWGSRAVAMLVFLFLARLLTPEDFGLASSAILVFSVAAMMVDLGIGDALIRRRDRDTSAFDTPFLISLAAAILIAGLVAINAARIAALLDIPRLAPFIVAAAILVPVSVAGSFQEAMMKRELRFRTLAVRALVSGLVGGCVGLGTAFAGYGPWAVMTQFAAQILVGTLWLWMRPVWRPGLRLTTKTFREIGGFGLNLVGMRMIDMATMRIVDLLVLAQLGPAAFGLFAVSTRLYQFLMQLFQASIASVGLTMLTHVAEDRERLGRVFVRTFSLSASLGSPVFFLLAALAPEASSLMFGAQWTGADRIMVPFLVVGGLHCILFSAGSYLLALGRADVLLRLMILKAALVLLPLLALRPAAPSAMADLIALGLLLEVPFTVDATARRLRVPWSALLRPVGLPLVGCLVATFVTVYVKAELLPDSGSAVRFFAGATTFVLAYGAFFVTACGSVLRENATYLSGAFRRAPSGR